MKLKPIITLAAALIAGAANAAEAPLWMRYASISPDGSKIAFAYKGDIFTVPTAGGKATRLTTQPSIETMPVWSPDGSMIAFASDREGYNDVYLMPAEGGPAKRLTFNSASEVPEAFTPDGKAVLFTAAIQAPAASRVFPSGRMTQLYRVGTDGGRPTQVLGTPARSVCFIPGTNDFLYQDVKGYEDEWRKHHTSSVTRDVWRYDANTGSHTNLTARAGEDRNPVVSPDGKTAYILSERDGGSFNVYSFPIADPSKATRLTDFTGHPVRFLSGAKNGTLAFTFDGEIYTLRPGGKPTKVSVDILTDGAPQILDRRFTSGSGSPAVSPDGKQVAFVNRGDIFVTSVDYPTTRRITSTAQGESSPTWGKDSRTLYYTSDRDGHDNIYMATIARKEDPNFPNATLIDEKPLVPSTDGIERMNPTVSPDGKKIAFVQGRRDIAVMDLATKKTKLLTSGNIYTARDGGIEFSWSPDSKWIVTTVDMHQRDPYYDIAVINAETGELTNITNDAYINQNPRWVMGGDAIIFESERYGMKNHASWGSSSDVLMVFTNREAYDKYRLSPEDYEIWQELNKKSAKKDEPETKTAAKGKKSSKKDTKKADAAADKSEKTDKPAAKAVKFEADGIRDRIVRLTPFSSDLGDAYVDDKGEELYFFSAGEDGYDLWKKDLRKGDVSLYKKLGAGRVSIQPDADGKNIFLLGSSSMKKMALAGGKTDNITFSAQQKIDRAAEREYMYDFLVREARERCFRVDMNGAPWDELAAHYRRFLPHINNNADFAEMGAELLGELNVSHSGARYTPEGSKEPTAQLGLLFDLTYAGPGMKVAEVVAGGPFDRAASEMKPGAVVTRINGIELLPATDVATLLAGQRGKKTLVEFTLPAGKAVSETVLPVSSAALADLMYNRWVERNRQLVDSLSGGRLGYVHLKSMSDPSYRAIYADVLGRYAERDGIVIDTRFNGGGRLHEDIEVLFSGKKYLTQVIRDVKSGEMPSRRWLRPSIMVTGEANYSNAHGTPWMYKHNKLGKLVGMPVPGTMSSVNWIDLQDPEVYFGIPVVGFRTAEGNYLENTQLEPDVKVSNAPADIVRGRDAQLETAVSELLKEIKK